MKLTENPLCHRDGEEWLSPVLEPLPKPSRLMRPRGDQQRVLCQQGVTVHWPGRQPSLQWGVSAVSVPRTSWLQVTTPHPHTHGTPTRVPHAGFAGQNLTRAAAGSRTAFIRRASPLS